VATEETDVAVDVTADTVEATGTAEVSGADPVAAETAGVAAEASCVAAEPTCVTVEVTGVTALDAAAAGLELAGGAELDAATAGLLAGELELAAEPELVDELDPVADDCAVTAVEAADTTCDVADSTGAVTAVTADVTGDEGTVAACADLADSSSATRIPAASIAPCTARRAMRRDNGCGMSSSRFARTTPDSGPNCPCSAQRNRAVARYSGPICHGLPKPDILYGHHRTAVSLGSARRVGKLHRREKSLGSERGLATPSPDARGRGASTLSTSSMPLKP
jgi:hypothetical protein